MITKGTQIAYIPNHAEDVTHPDCEFGFVTSLHKKDRAFCRFWRKGHNGDLRMVANSEMTLLDNLIEYETVPQIMVNKLIAAIEQEQADGR